MPVYQVYYGARMYIYSTISGTYSTFVATTHIYNNILYRVILYYMYSSKKKSKKKKNESRVFCVFYKIYLRVCFFRCFLILFCAARLEILVVFSSSIISLEFNLLVALLLLFNTDLVGTTI
jgi:hypothetical protein